MGISDFMFGKKQDEAAATQMPDITNLGKGKIGDMQKRTSSFSRRCMEGKIEVIERNCPYCNHHKAIKIVRNGSMKCSKCKRQL